MSATTVSHDRIGGARRHWAANLRSPMAVRLLSVLGVALVWESAGRGLSQFISYPSAIWSAFWNLAFESGTLGPALWVTFQGWIVGFLISATLGITIGFAMGRVRVIGIALEPYVTALYATPRIAVVPLLVLWVGIDYELRVTVVVLASIFPIIISVYVGSRNVPTRFLETARSFATGPWKTLTSVVIPTTLPYVFSGLRIGVAKGLSGVIVAEMTAAITGTGALIIMFGRFFQTDMLFVPVIILGLTAVVITRLVASAERRLMPWNRRTES